MQMMLRTFKLFLIVGLATACGDLSEGKKPHVEIVLGNAGAGVTSYELASITPGTQQRDTVEVEIKNTGKATLTIQSIRLLDNNLDGSPGNPWVTLDFGGFDPLNGLPHKIEPNDFVTSLTIQVVYEPGDCSEDDCKYTNTATLEIKSDDPDNPISTRTFAPPSCLPKPNVQPPKDTYFNATPVTPEVKTFQIHNDGNCEVSVKDITFNKATTKFTLDRKDSWPNGTVLLPVNDPGYEPLIFTVKYQPTANSSNDSVTVQVHMSDRIVPIEVVLKTQFESGSFEVSHNCGGDPAKLDFTDTDTGDKTCTVNVHNLGPASMSIKGICFPADEDETHYSVAAELPGMPPTPVTQPCNKDGVAASTVGLVEGRSVDIHVTYHGSINGMNADLVINYNNPDNGQITIPAFGGKAKSCFDYAPGDGSSPLVMQFIGEKDVETNRQFVIYSCGNAALTVTGFRFEDAFGLGNEAEYFAMKDPPTLPLEIPAGGVQLFEATMLVTDNDLSPGGTMYVDYIDPTGADVSGFGVDLKGLIGPEGTPPVAVPTADEGAKVGQQHKLTGSDSTPGSEGIATGGYVWFLTAKPAGSQVVINGGPGSADLTWVPDVAGTYTFALLVHGNMGDFLYSDMATLDVVVAAE